MDASDNRSLKWVCAQIASMDYAEALDLQRRLVSARIAGNLDRNAVLVLEHSPVFTLGRRGGLENLKVPESFLKQSGIPVVQVERGGTITYHGPGQLVVYPIVRLRDLKMRVVDYVERLEEVMILTAADLGVQAERNALNRGVWVEKPQTGQHRSGHPPGGELSRSGPEYRSVTGPFWLGSSLRASGNSNDLRFKGTRLPGFDDAGKRGFDAPDRGCFRR